MSKLLLSLLLPVAAWPQVVAFGVKGGVPFGRPTDDYGRLHIRSGHWVVGPTAEFRLPLHLGFEIGGLYSRYTTDYPVTQPAGTPGLRVWGRANTGAWDFPAIIKHRFLPEESPMRPFVFGGVNYRRENSHFAGKCDTPAGSCQAGSYDSSQDRLGPAFGGGVEWKFGYLRVAPEFRYVHLNRPGANQFKLLLGISF
jgi:hypothetical protein